MYEMAPICLQTSKKWGDIMASRNKNVTAIFISF